MQDQTQSKPTSAAADAKAPKPADTPAPSRAAHSDFVKRIVDKIKSSENILVTLSKTPSVDEFAAAIGLTLFLDNMQRHVTAIYSGGIPANLGFLNPESTFEQNTDSLQDFIIALNKDKADHLRYKLEGDYVRVYITPYRTTITENDLTFEHGDYNIDFIIAMNVNGATDLDPALTGENSGNILHDASTVNITVTEPGRFGEIEWSDPTASSICEMVTKLIFALQGQDTSLDRDIATALLSGIVAATDRFSNAHTTSDTLSLASKLMSLGADQQIITANINGNKLDTTNAPAPEVPAAVEVDPVTAARLKAQKEAEEAIKKGLSPAGSATPTNSAMPTNAPATPTATSAPATPGSAPAAPAKPATETAAKPAPAAPAPNPATAAAPSMPPSGAPSPATFVIPVAPIPGTPAPDTPKSSDNAPASAPATPAAAQKPDTAPKPLFGGGRERVESAPSTPNTLKQPQGVAVTPPVRPPEEVKDYSAMMEQALAEPLQNPGAPPLPNDIITTTSNATLTQNSPTLTPVERPGSVLPPPPIPPAPTM